MKPEALVALHGTANLVRSLIEQASHDQQGIIQHLVENNDAVCRFRDGTHMLRIAGVTATCTAGPGYGLVHAWYRAAVRRMEKEKAQHGADVFERARATVFAAIIAEHAVPGVEWHLDLVRCERRTLFLVAFDPRSGWLEREAVTHAVRQEIVPAMRRVMSRTVHKCLETIVTDDSHSWVGVARELGLRHRSIAPGKRSALERVAQRLIQNLDQDEQA